jgi:hypothetical protein
VSGKALIVADSRIARTSAQVVAMEIRVSRAIHRPPKRTVSIRINVPPALVASSAFARPQIASEEKAADGLLWLVGSFQWYLLTDRFGFGGVM